MDDARRDAFRLTILCGGLGGARLAMGLQAAGIEGHACFVTNVGDDLVVRGALVCPDTDAVLYALAGLFDDERGWGIRGDTFPPPGDGEHAWFNVGRQDRLHHLRRAELMGRGASLSSATRQLREELGVRSEVLPVTDALVRTRIRVNDAWLAFQEWLVRDHAQPTPHEVSYAGAAAAVPAPGVLEAIAAADVVVLASSSPVASIDPILAVPGVRQAVADRSATTVAVSPVASRLPLRTERDVRRSSARERLLEAVGVPHTAVAVAERYVGLADVFVLDPADRSDVDDVEALGFEVLVHPVAGTSANDRRDLVDALLALTWRRP